MQVTIPLPYFETTNSKDMTNHMITADFNKAMVHAETKAMFDLDDKWCVCIRYGVFGAFPLAYALEHDYAITLITIY